jgi:hypothetical protein
VVFAVMALQGQVFNAGDCIHREYLWVFCKIAAPA